MSRIDTDRHYDGGRDAKEDRESCPGCGCELNLAGECREEGCDYYGESEFDELMADAHADSRYDREEDRRAGI